MSTIANPKKSALSDPSLWVLLISNIITIYIAYKENWNISTLMWIYWCQSVIIGIFNFIRIWQLEEFSTDNFEISGQPVEPTKETKTFTAFFFLFHYGLFHLIYLFFLMAGLFSDFLGEPPSLNEFQYVGFTAVIFFLNHLFSYFYNRPKDTKKQNIGALMFYPYARIIPMHLTLIFGLTFEIMVPVFLTLKTIADCIMHYVEHAVLRKGELNVLTYEANSKTSKS